MSDFHFLEPLWLLALLPLGALLAWLARPGGGDGPWRRVMDAPLLAALLVDAGGQQRRLPLGLLGTGWLLAVLALANPTIEREPVPAFRPSAARVLILDLSRSMLAADLTPHRLARARFKVADLLARGGDGQTALLVFAGEPFVVAPLTDDAATITNLLAVLEPDLMPLQGSRVDRAIQQAADLLAQAGAHDSEVLLLADEAGDDRALAAAAALRAGGHRLSVIGVGTPAGAPVPGVRRADGPVLAALDEPALRALAAAGGGAYARITADDADLGQVLRAPPVTAARPDQDPRFAERWKPLGPWMTLTLLPLAALAFRRGWLTPGLLPPLLLALPLGALTPAPVRALDWTDLWQRREQQAAAALARGDFAGARTLTADPARRGAALYREGDYAAAAAAFAAGNGATDHYNRGNALARAGDLEGALLAYDQAIARQPDLQDARVNRALVEAALRQREPPPNQQGEPADQNGEGDPQDGASQDAGRTAGDRGGDQTSEQAGGQSGDRTGDQEGNQADQAGASGAPDPGHRPGPQPDQPHGESAPPPADQGQASPGGGAGAKRQGQSGETGQPGAGADAPEPANGGAANPGPPLTQASDGAAEPRASDAEASTPEQEQAQAGQPGGRDQGPATEPPATAGDPARTEQAAADWRDQAAGAGPAPGAAGPSTDPAPLSSEDEEARIAADQWLRRIPDDPGGLLRRKFLYQYQQRTDRDSELDSSNPW